MFDEEVDDLAELPGAEDDLAVAKEIAARELDFRAFRCFFLADSYREASKWAEAEALFERAADLAADAEEHERDRGTAADQARLSALEALAADANGKKSLTHATGVLAAVRAHTEIEGGIDGLSLAAPLPDGSRPTLLQRLDCYDAGDAKQHHNIAEVPPAFEAVPCKPVLFDLAFNGLQFPALDGRTEAKSGGGLFGWFRR